MKIDENTINVLKNFSKINSSLVFPEGNVLKTISPSKCLMAQAVVPTSFKKRFALSNINRLIATLGLFENPQLNFNDKFLTISDSNKSSRLMYVNEEVIHPKVNKNPINMGKIIDSFVLKDSDLKEVEKALGTLALPEFHITADGENIYLQAANNNNPSSDIYSIKVGESTRKYRAVMKAENIKLLPGDYNIEVSERGLLHLIGKNVEYWIALENTSEFKS